MTINKIVSFLAFTLIFLSCGDKLKSQKNTDNDNIVTVQADIITVQSSDTILTNDEVIIYFETFRGLLTKGEIEKLTDLVHFPVEGDYSWERTNEDGKVVRDFNPYRGKEDLIENYSKLFGEDLVNVLEKVDFQKALEENYSVTIKKKPNVEISFNVDFINWLEPIEKQKPTMVSFGLNFDEIDCDICEHGVIYRFQKVDGIIKLTAIQFVG